MDTAMTDAESCYTSNCECWVVVSRSRAIERTIERRNAADLLGKPPSILDFEFRDLYFVPHTNTPKKVKLLGTFRSYDLVDPGDDDDKDKDNDSDMIDHVIPPPPSPPTSSSTLSLHLPLFSLACATRTALLLDEDRKHVLQPGVYDDVGLSYSLPLCPPPSQMIPSQEHLLPADADDARMIGSCNGLYCLRHLSDSDKVSVILWNPTTAVSRKLPPFSGSDWDWDYDCGGLAFGFGYDQSSGDYKVVKIDAENLQVEVFSLYSDSDSWRTVPAGFTRDWDFQWRFCNAAVSFAGCLNWVVSADGEAMVASFDLATETFRMLPLPPTYGARPPYLLSSSLWILDGCLSFVTSRDLSPKCGQRVPGWYSRVLDIWIMREYGVESSWTSAATIALPLHVYCPYRILYLSKDVLILDNYPRLFVFNLKENSLACPQIEGATDGYGGAEPYVQSEVSPYCRTGDSQ